MYEFRHFTFLWPAMLWLLALVPVLVIVYLRLLARQRRRTERYASLNLAGLVPGKAHWLLRHGPPVLLLLGLAALIVAIARPQAVITLPVHADAIILAMDISGSMRATDIKPNRLAAAQKAAKAFIAEQPAQVRIGVVSIAATVALAQSPTDKREDIVAAIDRFQLQPGSALGSGIVIALNTLLPDSGIDVDKVVFGKSSNWPYDSAKQARIENFKPVPPGSNESVAIVLLSDGANNFGPDLVEAGKLAAERGVRVYTVGVGTTSGETLTVEGWSMRVKLDEEALKKLALTTRGEYYQAANASELTKIYKNLGSRIAMGKGRQTEMTAMLVALGAALATLAVLFSMLRFNRVL
jgi:Ca-activated chloride channel family protein